ncbi:MAG: hypothetical protein H6668_08140 [Ardenticatenaceae bacterium]|nr:hypothetical protein [Ardenticatenaceae bacterium]
MSVHDGFSKGGVGNGRFPHTPLRLPANAARLRVEDASLLGWTFGMYIWCLRETWSEN